jgi:hypothetical protein
VEDRAVPGRGRGQGRGRVGFRPPLASLLLVPGILVLMALIFPSEATWTFVVVFVVGFSVVRIRQLLVLTDDHLEVTVFRTRRIPWDQVQGFEPGSWLRGGSEIQTSSGVVHSVSPCSWWGGPADAADLETLRREARARR